MNILEYEFEGNAQVCCDHCGICYEIEFTGTNTECTNIEETIRNKLEEDGWEGDKCPSCIESEEENGYNEDGDYDSSEDFN